MARLHHVDWSRLTAPTDDGAADHLTGTRLPGVALASTRGDAVDLSRQPGRTVVFAYPMTGHPDRDPPDGWDGIPGARGCTPQACAFRDMAADLKRMGADRLFGLSAQSPEAQAEAADRLHLPFPLLSDDGFALADALRLPTFATGGVTYLRRLTFIAMDGRIEAVLYPVFPPDRAAIDVAEWLATHAAADD